MKQQLTYNLILNESEMVRFFDLLPELKENEAYMLLLQIRKKYCKDVKHDQILHRKLVYKKERLLREVKKMELPFGSYEIDGKPVPQEAMVLYIKINPRNTHIFDAALDFLTRFKNNEFKSVNPSNVLLSYLQDRQSKRHFALYDFDIKNTDNTINDLLNSLADILGETKYHLIETYGGYHLMVELKTLDKKKTKGMFEKLNNHPYKDKDSVSDIHSPVIGGYQGGFEPKLISIN
jgi:hypothetical protein